MSGTLHKKRSDDGAVEPAEEDPDDVSGADEVVAEDEEAEEKEADDDGEEGPGFDVDGIVGGLVGAHGGEGKRKRGKGKGRRRGAKTLRYLEVLWWFSCWRVMRAISLDKLGMTELLGMTIPLNKSLARLRRPAVDGYLEA